MNDDTQPSVEAQWDAWSSGAEETTSTPSETPTETETEPLDEVAAEPVDDLPDNDDDLLGNSTTDIDSIRSEMAALKQQFEQERLQYQEMLRRAQQSFRDTGASLLERVEERLAPVQDTLVDLVKRQLLTPEDAQSRLQAAERQFRAEELKKDKDQREWNARQEWLRQQQAQQQPQTAQAPNQDVESVNAQITAMMQRYGITAQDLTDAGAPDDISHLSPVQALLTSQKWVIAAAKMKQARTGQPVRNNGRQFAYPDMGGGAGVPARSAEGITAELNAEMRKTNPNYERIAELNTALDKYIQ